MCFPPSFAFCYVLDFPSHFVVSLLFFNAITRSMFFLTLLLSSCFFFALLLNLCFFIALLLCFSFAIFLFFHNIGFMLMFCVIFSCYHYCVFFLWCCYYVFPSHYHCVCVILHILLLCSSFTSLFISNTCSFAILLFHTFSCCSYYVFFFYIVIGFLLFMRVACIRPLVSHFIVQKKSFLDNFTFQK